MLMSSNKYFGFCNAIFWLKGTRKESPVLNETVSFQNYICCMYVYYQNAKFVGNKIQYVFSYFAEFDNAILTNI